MTIRTALYRHWDVDGNLLYVGISLSAVHRLTQHKRDSHWHDQIANMTIEWFETREEALEAERTAIQLERPIFNKMHKAANDNDPVEIITVVDGMCVYLVRDIETKLFQGVFWASSKAELWDTFDEFGDPYGYEFAEIRRAGAIVHPGRGFKVQQWEELSDSEAEVARGVSWRSFEASESLSDVLYYQSRLNWEPFCAADEDYGMIARVFGTKQTA